MCSLKRRLEEALPHTVYPCADLLMLAARWQLRALAECAVCIPADMRGAEIAPAVALSSGELLVTFSSSFSPPQTSPARVAEATSSRAGAGRRAPGQSLQGLSARQCRCDSPWCAACDMKASSKGRIRWARASLGRVLEYWGRGRAQGQRHGGDIGVTGLTELLLRQMGQSKASPESVVGDGYRYLLPAGSLPAAHQVSGAESEGSNLNQLEPNHITEIERSWEAFLVGMLGVLPHFDFCKDLHWWAVASSGSSGDCAICKEGGYLLSVSSAPSAPSCPVCLP